MGRAGAGWSVGRFVRARARAAPVPRAEAPAGRRATGEGHTGGGETQTGRNTDSEGGSGVRECGWLAGWLAGWGWVWRSPPAPGLTRLSI